MQKLKKVFSPGNDKDDEVMYGSPAARKASTEAASADQGTSGTSANKTTNAPSDGKEHGITRQILNPDGDKYEEQRFGQPAGTSHTSAEREQALDSRMGDAKEDRSVKREVLDPEKSTRDEAGYGTTAFKGKDNTTNPSGASSTRPDVRDTQSGLSMKSGVLGSPDQHTEERALYSDGIATQDESSSNLGRNTALAGAGAAAGAGGVYAATRPSDDPRSNATQDPTHTDRSFPLRGGAIAGHSDDDKRPTSSRYSAEGTGPTSTAGPTDLSTVSGLHTGTAGGTAASSGENARSNLGLAQYADNNHQGHSHQFQGDPCETSPTVAKTLSNIRGPHATVAANMLDPHVPGEFPTDDGLDPHGSHAGSGFGGAADQPSSTSTTGPAIGSGFKDSPQPHQSSDDHHYGRNAALAGGAGVAGLGAYAASKDRDGANEPRAPQGSSTTEPSTQQRGSSLPIAEQFTSQPGNVSSSAREPPAASDPVSSSSDKDHHYGRNAALAAGTGAAGYGAYKYSQDRDNADPTSRLTDPYDTYKDAADPRVNPDTTSSSSTTRPHQSETMNKADPRVPSSSSATQQQPLGQDKDNHYGRDAALAGGAGAAGYGAYQYSKDRGDTDPTSTRAQEPSTGTANTYADPHTTSRTAAPASIEPHQPDALNKADPRVDSNSYTAQQHQKLVDDDKDKDHHYGRNAALAGGAGAAGAAGYAALQDDRGDTGPASKTIGPHKSNLANIVDPRVRPEPETMKDHTTAGPWQSDTLNKLDPKVESDPNKADVKAHGYASGVPTQPQHMQQQQQPVEDDKDHHYGRNAAAAGGAGAAAYGASQAYDQHEQEKLAKEQAKEQEKLAKEQDKQAKHDAKEKAKEDEKKATHDAKEKEKQDKHDAHEAEKARKKEEEKRAKEQEKLDKQHAKEQEKAEEKRLKEQEKAEKEHAKEQEKLEKEKEKENSKLAAARADEAEAKHHNKLHKDAPEEREKKDGILHRIFHHKHHEREGAEGTREGSGSFEERERPGQGSNDTRRDTDGDGAFNNDKTGPASSSGFGQQTPGQSGLSGGDEGMVTEGTTGLPMNVGKYGSGAGGTDGGEHIAGYHAK